MTYKTPRHTTDRRGRNCPKCDRENFLAEGEYCYECIRTLECELSSARYSPALVQGEFVLFEQRDNDRHAVKDNIAGFRVLHDVTDAHLDEMITMADGDAQALTKLLVGSGKLQLLRTKTIDITDRDVSFLPEFDTRFRYEDAVTVADTRKN